MKNSKFNDIFKTFMLTESDEAQQADNPTESDSQEQGSTEQTSEVDETVKKAAEAGFKAIEHIKEKENKQEIIEGAINAVESGESGSDDVVKLLEAIKQALGDETKQQPAQVQKEFEQSGDGTDKTIDDITEDDIMGEQHHKTYTNIL